LILSDPPYGEANTEAKVSYRRLFVPHAILGMLINRLLQNTTLMSLLDIINSTKSSDIPVIVKSLSLDEQDRLMKYIYKGLSSPELGASAVLLGWHEKVSARLMPRIEDIFTHLFTIPSAHRSGRDRMHSQSLDGSEASVVDII
jgi:hypothetical protein